MTQRTVKNRHSWINDPYGKTCEKCGSHINETRKGFPRYIETDMWGVSEPVNHYPACNPPKNTDHE